MRGLKGKNRDGSKVTFDDRPVKEFLIKFFRETHNWELKMNEDKYGIDLLSVDGSCPNIECERSNCEGNFWESKSYSLFLSDGNPKIDFQTINIPYRKNHYWVGGDHYKDSGKFWYTEVNHESNIFARTNYEFTQVILIKPDVIRDESKRHVSAKKPFNINKNELEYWIGFKKEDVETWCFNKEKEIWEIIENTNEVQ